MSSHHAIKIFHLVSPCKTLQCCQSFWNTIFWHHIISLHFFWQTSYQGNYIRKPPIIALFPTSLPDTDICVHFHSSPTIHFQRGKHCCSARLGIWNLLLLWNGGFHCRLAMRKCGSGSLHVSMGEATSLRLETATTWEADCETYARFWTLGCFAVSWLTCELPDNPISNVAVAKGKRLLVAR